jgi:hypothetical protein
MLAGLGVAGALIVSHLMAGLLYGVSPTDLATFAAVTLVLTTVALAASYIPAPRAIRLDPITYTPLPMTSCGEFKNSNGSRGTRIARARSGTLEPWLL